MTPNCVKRRLLLDRLAGGPSIEQPRHGPDHHLPSLDVDLNDHGLDRRNQMFTAVLPPDDEDIVGACFDDFRNPAQISPFGCLNRHPDDLPVIVGVVFKGMGLVEGYVDVEAAQRLRFCPIMDIPQPNQVSALMGPHVLDHHLHELVADKHTIAFAETGELRARAFDDKTPTETVGANDAPDRQKLWTRPGALSCFVG